MDYMSVIYNLTHTEQRIMELLWDLNKPLSLKETMDYLNSRLSKQWKEQTVGTYLCNLQKADLIQVDKLGARFYIYSPMCTEEEFKQRCTKKIIENSFDGSVGKFVAAFTGGKKLPAEDVEELKGLL